jgi:aromatase
MTTATNAVTHTTRISADPGDVYQLVADATRWPVVFGPTVHVELLHHTDSAERFTIWALVGEGVARWTSTRTFDPGARRITFEQEHTMPPFAAMGGRWEFIGHAGPGTEGTETEVVLTHQFSVDSSADGEDEIRRALDRNSDSELRALRRVAEAGHPLNQLIFEFEDVVRIAGPVAAAYEFIDRAGEWDRRLPHVGSVNLAEPTPGIQHLTMETVTGDGAKHTTTSVRVCMPHQWIAYKQTVIPAPLLGHSGIWSFRDLGESGCLVAARHLVLLNPAEVTLVGPGGLTAVSRDIAERVKKALSGNSKVTLEHARQFAER